MTTTTFERTLQEVLEQANPQEIADAFRKVGVAIGSPVIKIEATGLTSSASFDITTLQDASGSVTITGWTADGDADTLPPLGACLALTDGTDPYTLVDDAVAPVAQGALAIGLASISDDGTTITFEAAKTALTLHYMPRTRTALTDTFAPST